MVTLFQLPLAYLWWHYTTAWVDLARLYTNLVWFLWHYFSFGLLARTLLAPWKRLRETKGGAGDSGFLGRLIINSVTRIVGFVLRSLVMLAGLAALLLFSAAFALFFLLWLVLPFAAVALLGFGIISAARFLWMRN